MPLPATWVTGSKRFRYARNTNLLPPNPDRMSFEQLPFFDVLLYNPIPFFLGFTMARGCGLTAKICRLPHRKSFKSLYPL